MKNDSIVKKKSIIALVDIQIGRAELNSIAEVINSRWVTEGPKVQLFEKIFAQFIGTKYAVATSSCTSALQIALAEYKLPNDAEIITTPFTWESTITAIIYAGATPIFADVDPNTFNISPESIQEKITKKTKGIVVMHYAGLPVDIQSIKKIAQKYGLFIIEDSAHALGSEFCSQKTGGLGDAGCFSFGSTKTITTGEGGMITTNNRAKYERYKILKNYGETKSSLDKKGADKWAYDIIELSYNFKMNEFAAAIGIEQMKRLSKIIDGRVYALKLYQQILSGCHGIKIQKVDKQVKYVPLNFPIVLNESNGNIRRKIMLDIEKSGIETSIYYPLVYKLSIFKKLFNYNIECPNAEKISDSIFSLPCHGKVKAKHITKIKLILKKHLG
ncbi:MAG: DegT/DnrJ/EryC1/StrS family aminotransferase [Candidatus Levybacteria bacterium]|nr:DegT/DnrJ/EryC1/StrS family aminotransferase [Candidatus Levybacteria bacterium]